MKLTFLGTGGGRFCMRRQIRQTGGFVVETEDMSLFVDPAPGALVYGLENDVSFRSLDGVFISHGHLDHMGDLAAVVEAMTNGCTNERGKLVANQTVLYGDDRFDKALSSYHREAVAEAFAVEKDDAVDFDAFRITVTETDHKDIPTHGFVLDAGEKKLGYVPDTELVAGLDDQYEEADILVVNAPRPHDREWRGHMNLEDALELIRDVNPEKAFVQHFGMRFVMQFREEMEWLDEQELDVDVTLASDNTTYTIDGGLSDFL